VDIQADELAEAADEIAQEAAVGGGELRTDLVDVSDFAQVADAVDATVATWGRIDVLVNNAAIMPPATFAEMTPELWRRVIDINLSGVFYGVKAAWPHMVRQGGGHCMAIASGSSVRGSARESAYCATKHGLEGFIKATAIEAEAHAIALNSLGPGKRIKPTSISRAAAADVPPAEQQIWHDPIVLSPALIWLAMQPPLRYTGLRFDAGPIVDTLAAEGFDFAFAPEKVTAYPADMAQRLDYRRQWSRVGDLHAQ
jgi:NAD(P)-dependent dehydrogenase (short-subunit alcohol dehydrogenase family)